MEIPFSIREAVRFGWYATRKHSGLVFKVVLIIVGLSLLQLILKQTGLSGLVSILSFIIGVGATALVLKLARNEPASFKDLWPTWKMFFQYGVSSLAVGFLILLVFVVVMGTAVLLIGIPEARVLIHTPSGVLSSPAIFPLLAAGVVVFVLVLYLAVRFSMVRFIAVDGTHRIFDILDRSAKLTQGVKWRLLLFSFVIVLLNIAGFLALLVGLLVTIPISMIATAHVYVKLCERYSATSLVVSEK